jgi:hypothetical protein
MDAPSQDAIEALTKVIPLKDAPILAAAVIAAPARLVTLDSKHFIDPPEVAAVSGLTIVTPGDMLREIRNALGSSIRKQS